MSVLRSRRQSSSSTSRPPLYLSSLSQVTSPISAREALTVTPVYACVAKISESVGSARLVAQHGGRSSPRFEQLIASVPWGTIAGWLALDKNAYLFKLRDASGLVQEFIPYPPWQVQVQIDPDGTVIYRIGGWSGGPRDILHLRGPLSTNGVTGASPVSLNAGLIRRAQAIFDYFTNYYLNGSAPGGQLNADGELTDDQAGRLKKAWESAHSGINRNRVAVLENGVKYVAGPPLDDGAGISALVETVWAECARMFHIPPTSLGLSAGRGLTYNNTNQVSEAYYTQAVLPIASIIERGISEDPDTGPESSSASFDFSDLLRADDAARWAVYQQGLATGVMSRAWVAGEENLPVPPPEGFPNAPAAPPAAPKLPPPAADPAA